MQPGENTFSYRTTCMVDFPKMSTVNELAVSGVHKAATE